MEKEKDVEREENKKKVGGLVADRRGMLQKQERNKFRRRLRPREQEKGKRPTLRKRNSKIERKNESKNENINTCSAHY